MVGIKVTYLELEIKIKFSNIKRVESVKFFLYQDRYLFDGLEKENGKTGVFVTNQEKILQGYILISYPVLSLQLLKLK